MKTQKITLATVKSFIKKNSEELFINAKSSFSGMTDGLESLNAGFQKVEIKIDCNHTYTQGIEGAWFVGGSRDYFAAYEDNFYTGIEVYNSCGRFILAIKKPKCTLTIIKS